MRTGLFLETGADGIMIGRAAVGNPFLFKQVKEYLNEGKSRATYLLAKVSAFAKSIWI
jgi:tRNA-dihydrouridine synthase